MSVATPSSLPPLSLLRSPSLLVIAAGLLALVIPTFMDLARQYWRSDDQGHGPIIVGVSLWLMWRNRQALLTAPSNPQTVWGSLVLSVALLGYTLGRSQAIVQLEVASLIVTVVGLVLLLKGVSGLRVWAFPLFFLIFMIPLPGVFVQAITIPLKSGVSAVAEWAMYQADYPIARSGVVLNVGQYQLLVADACAGLNSMFTLESLGLLYMNLMGYSSKLRNTLLAILVVPIAFFANVVRVIVLILVTYHFGDEAGQGFVHTFAGILLFLVGLVLMLGTDSVLGKFIPQDKLSQQ